ncbi:hypothetical protein CWATWH8502_2899 [Crocosphaera watsonii WH 8502]|uniref:Uncharacterized protein n=1 Tax=Crocosphaera watsonii WH 8502 TaxID=423474 RepID=T2IB62_CROWT|nr:hypothetical protein [Crocosphaera watsonii]CCQ50766.1 hypothetical protein CWATWH8502_2899 [Crocosphaera watsonii WH 8502]
MSEGPTNSRQSRLYIFNRRKKRNPTFNYAELDQQAKAIAALLQKYQARGERALPGFLTN